MAQYTSAYSTDGVIFDIEDLEGSGKSRPNYFCIGCNSEVIPKMGNEREWHFAHKSTLDSECPVEHWLHFESKKRLFEILKRMISNQNLEIPQRITKKCEFAKHNQRPRDCERKDTVYIDVFQNYDSIELKNEPSDRRWAPNIYICCDGTNTYFEITINTRHSSTIKYEKTIEFLISNPNELSDQNYLEHLRNAKIHNFQENQISSCDCRNKRVEMKISLKTGKVESKEWPRLIDGIKAAGTNYVAMSYHRIKNTCSTCHRFVKMINGKYACFYSSEEIGEPFEFSCDKWQKNQKPYSYSVG